MKAYNASKQMNNPLDIKSILKSDVSLLDKHYNHRSIDITSIIPPEEYLNFKYIISLVKQNIQRNNNNVKRYRNRIKSEFYSEKNHKI